MTKEACSSEIGNGTKRPDDLGMILALFSQKKIDGRDLIILDCVNQRMTIREIGQAMKIPAATVQYRLDRMQKKAAGHC